MQTTTNRKRSEKGKSRAKAERSQRKSKKVRSKHDRQQEKAKKIARRCAINWVICHATEEKPNS